MIVVKTHFLRHNDSMSALSSALHFVKNNLLQLIALTILVLSLLITWSFFQNKNKFPEGTHIAIQDEFQKIVQKKILERNSLAHNIRFNSIWTETTKESSQIRAVFSYSFNDPNDNRVVDVKVTGSALINRQDNNLATDNVEKWEVGAFEVNQTEISFNNELLIISPKNQKENQKDKKASSEENNSSQDSSTP